MYRAKSKSTKAKSNCIKDSVYIDDGYSGTNFQRPSFQNMIKDIENGLINCVITKDLSRLGRNYLDCGLYLEVFFPEHNVRYIAVNDGVDTLNKFAMDITPFRNILNEMYSADVSVKIKSAYRARFQQGKFMGTYAPYDQLRKLETDIMVDMAVYVDSITPENVHDIKKQKQTLKNILDYILQKKHIFQVLLTRGGDYDLQKDILSFFGERLFTSVKKPSSEEELSLHYKYIYASTGAFGIIYHWIVDDSDLSTDKVAQMITEFTGNMRK